MPQENAGREFLFPHVLPSEPARAASELPSTPWMDQLTLEAALEGLQALDLGRGPQTDLLAISLSATDYVGHRYGPDSREQHDNVLHLDRALGTFIDSLFRLRDSNTIVFALTADHGVTSFPELAAQRAGRAPPPRYDISTAMRTLRGMLQGAGVELDAVDFDGTLVTVDRTAFARARIDPDPLLARFAAFLRRRPGIARVDRVRDLAQRDTLRDAVSRRWLHMLSSDAGVEYVVTPMQGAYPAGAQIAEHGSPYDDDARVPLIFYGAGIRPGRIVDRALVVDAAPTLARVIGVTPYERLDGRVLTRALVGRGALTRWPRHGRCADSPDCSRPSTRSGSVRLGPSTCARRCPVGRRQRDGWMRGFASNRCEQAGELLVITGRGNNSESGIAVVREATLRVFHELRRKGVVRDFAEHTPGSFVVTVVPMQRMRGDGSRGEAPRVSATARASDAVRVGRIHARAASHPRRAVARRPGRARAGSFRGEARCSGSSASSPRARARVPTERRGFVLRSLARWPRWTSARRRTHEPAPPPRAALR